jgi:hypothetical protein
LGVKPIKPSQTNLLPPKYNQLTIQNIKGVWNSSIVERLGYLKKKP